jgi:hypothetical protein
MARITRYVNHSGFMLQHEDGDYVRYGEVAPYIKEAGQPAHNSQSVTALKYVEERLYYRSADMINEEIELQALICEREGMVAENTYSANLGQGVAYSDAEFGKLSDRIRALKTVETETRATNNARLEIAEKLLKLWLKYWDHTANLTTAEAVDLQNETYSFINSSATSAVA